jgi:type IX secretion system PorP/SprF family membrane protein
MKKYSLFFAFIWFSLGLKAQETAPNFLGYRYNMNILNPAYVGEDGKNELNMSFRKQSLALQDDPITQTVSYSKLLQNNLGIGVSLVNDKNHIRKQTDFGLDLSYTLPLDATTSFSFGMKLGVGMYAIDFSSLEIFNDPLFSENQSHFSPKIGFGGLLKGARYYVNISSPNLIVSEVLKPVTDGFGSILSEGAKEKLHVYTGAGYRFTIHDNLDLTSSFFARFVADSDVLIDISVLADIAQKVELGMTYRWDTSFIGTAMLKIIENTYFGYAYEAVTSDFSAVSNGTHEFLIRFRFH